MASPTGGGFQQAMRDLAHRPFQQDLWQLYLFLLALPLDGTTEKLNQGVHDHLVDDADASALPYIAADRGTILRGLTESDASFRARLKTALDDLRLAGNAWSILRQVLGYVLASTPRAFIVSSAYTAAGACDTSTWDLYADGQTTAQNPTHSLYSTGNWNWDQFSPTTGSWGWWRWYLVIDYQDIALRSWIGKDGKWGSGGKWGDGLAWGVNVSSLVGKSVYLIVKQWQSNWCHWIIICFDGALFDPAAAEGGGVNPDGYFGRWSKLSGGVYTRARFADACYFEGPI